ncbi:hypothetical protein [Micromonospora sp. NPDC048839]
MNGWHFDQATQEWVRWVDGEVVVRVPLESLGDYVRWLERVT